jgi:hypothetical protein
MEKIFLDAHSIALLTCSIKLCWSFSISHPWKRSFYIIQLHNSTTEAKSMKNFLPKDNKHLKILLKNIFMLSLLCHFHYFSLIRKPWKKFPSFYSKTKQTIFSLFSYIFHVVLMLEGRTYRKPCTGKMKPCWDQRLIFTTTPSRLHWRSKMWRQTMLVFIGKYTQILMNNGHWWQGWKGYWVEW